MIALGLIPALTHVRPHTASSPNVQQPWTERPHPSRTRQRSKSEVTRCRPGEKRRTAPPFTKGPIRLGHQPSQDTLETIVQQWGVAGEWRDIQGGRQFKGISGETITWYSKQGITHVQGKNAPATYESLDKAFSKYFYGDMEAAEAAEAEAVAVSAGSDEMFNTSRSVLSTARPLRNECQGIQASPNSFSSSASSSSSSSHHIHSSAPSMKRMIEPSCTIGAPTTLGQANSPNPFKRLCWRAVNRDMTQVNVLD